MASRFGILLDLRNPWPTMRQHARGRSGGIRESLGRRSVREPVRRERLARFAEFVALVDPLLRDERASYHGTYYWAVDVRMLPAPLQWPRPPLAVAAHRPKALRLAAEHADTWSFYEPGAGLTGDAAYERVRAMNRTVDEHARAAGRDPATITRSLCRGFAASSAWSTIEEALEGVAQFERAGVNEFVFGYAPPISVQGDAPRDAELLQGQTPSRLPDEVALASLARALGLVAPTV